MKTKFTKHVEWLRPFFESAGDLVPIERVKSVQSFKVPRGKTEQTDAIIQRYGNNKTFSISIRTHSQEIVSVPDGDGIKAAVRHKRRYISPLLDSLAHELSHIKHWDHTPAHYELQVKIMLRFAKVLKKLKVKDTWAMAPLRRQK